LIRPDTSRCIVSLATDRKAFPLGLIRLRKTLDQIGFGGECRFWSPGNFPPGCPAHLEVPFAFKPFCLAEARSHGRKTLLWLDSSCLVIRSLELIFEAIETNGYLLFKNGSNVVGEWASDAALCEFGLSRERALAVPEIRAAAIGLDLRCAIGVEFLDAWHEAARKEVPFRGIAEKLEDWHDYGDVKWNRSGRVSSDSRVRGHRHDQTVASILADRLGMELTPAGLEVYSERRPIRPTTAIVIERSMRVELPALTGSPART
jgi:hypothetical protein